MNSTSRDNQDGGSRTDAPGARRAFLFAGVPAEGAAAGVGPIASEAAYRACWRAGEEAFGVPLSLAEAGAPAAARDGADVARDVAATLHGCAAWEAVKARGRVGALDLLAAHSLGLYAALYAAGSLDLAGALALSAEAARGIAEAGAARPSGLLAVVGLPLDAAASLAAAHGCAVAGRNSAHQAVLGGEASRLDGLALAARAAGALDVRRVAVPCALHTPFAAVAAARVRAALDESRAVVRDPAREVVVGNDPVRLRTAAEARDALARNLETPLDWPVAVRALGAAGVTSLVDLGPGDALGRLARFIDRDLPSVALDGTRDAAAARRWLAPAGAEAIA